MPKETIRKLGEDVSRVLIAGAHLAPADPELAADRQKLEGLEKQFGDKAPVIGQLAQQVGRAIAGSEAARELVGLATSVAQVRAAQTTLAPATSIAVVEPAPEIGSPCNARDVYDLHDALITSGSGRQEKVQQACERKDIADLRLVDAIVQAMGDSYLGEYVTKHAIPLVGKAIVAPIRARLNLKGGAVDGRRLRALVAVEKENARELLAAGIRDGSAAVREAALDAIGDHVRGVAEFESLVLEIVGRERAGGVKRAAVRALAGFKSDAALEALAAALEFDATRAAAAEALGASPHPRAVARLMAALEEALAGKGGKPKDKKDEKEARRERVAAILVALTPHKSAAIATRAIGLMDEFGAQAAQAVLASGDAAQLARVADRLAGSDEALFAAAAQAASRLDDAFKRLSAPFKAKDRSSKTGLARIAAAADQVGVQKDPRWGDLLVAVVKDEPGPVAQHAIRVLGRAKEPRAVKVLLETLKTEKSAVVRSETIRALGAIGDASAVDPILAAIGSSSDYHITWAAHQAILDIGDPASVGKVRALVAAQKDTQKEWWFKYLLHALERKFPGA